jgi:PST family polysaccharide transporter
MIFPFVSMIYLQYKISLVELGIVAFVFTSIDIVVGINDFGVNLNYIKKVSEQKNQINLYLSELIYARCLLMIVLLPLLFLFLLLTHAIDFSWMNILGIVIYYIGLLFYPIWFYQSIQNVKTISLINIFFKSITMLSILILIQDIPSFKSFYVLIIGFSFLLPTLFSWVDIYLTHTFKCVSVTIQDTLWVIKNSFSNFIASFSDFMLVNSPFYIIKFIFPGTEANYYLGIYSSCDKYIRSLSYLSIPLSQSIYPRMLELKSVGVLALFAFLNKVARITLPALLFICLSVGLVFYLLLDYNILNENFEKLSPYFYILLAFPLIYTIQGSFFYQLILVYNLQNYYAKLIVLLFIGAVMGMSISTYYLKLWGLIATFQMSYLILLILMWLKIKNTIKINV